MSNKPTNGKADSKGGSGGDGGISSITAGLQSVMAVIGETYDPSSVSDIESPAPAKPSPSKLTDKLQASKDPEGSSSVTKGLQSILAVIGETYEDEPVKPELPVASSNTSYEDEPAQYDDPAPYETSAPYEASAPYENSTGVPLEEENEEERDALQDVMSFLTEDEKRIGHMRRRAVDEYSDQYIPDQYSHDQYTPDQYAPNQYEVFDHDRRRALEDYEPEIPVIPAAYDDGNSNASIQGLLEQLRSDITQLEHENAAQRVQYNMPNAIDSASVEVRGLLHQLQSDISALRHENDALKVRYNIPVSGQGGEVASLLAQLQGDITSLHAENDALKRQYGIPVSSSGSGEVSSLLAQLQGDIVNLRKENDAFRSYYNMPTPSAKSGTSIGQAFLMAVGLLALLGIATFTGFYFANRMNDESKQNLLAMIGMQQAQTEASKTSAKTDAQFSTTAQPAQKAPELPKLTVNQPKLETAEVKAMIAEADKLIRLGDLVSARQMLEYAMGQDSAEAAFRLAQTYDPLYLSRIATVLSVEPDLTRAKVLYYAAARQGNQEASKRLNELRQANE